MKLSGWKEEVVHSCWVTQKKLHRQHPCLNVPTGSDEERFSLSSESVSIPPASTRLTPLNPFLDHKLFRFRFSWSSSHPSLICSYISSKNLVIRVPTRGDSENYSKSIKVFLVRSGPHAAEASEHVVIYFRKVQMQFDLWNECQIAIYTVFARSRRKCYQQNRFPSKCRTCESEVGEMCWILRV